MGVNPLKQHKENLLKSSYPFHNTQKNKNKFPKIVWALFAIFLLSLLQNCSSTDEKADVASLPKKEAPPKAVKPAETPQTPSSPSASEEDTKFVATPQPTTTSSRSNEPDIENLEKNCKPYNEEEKKSKCTGSLGSLKGETFLEFDLRKSQKAHISIELSVKEGELKIDVPSSKSGIAKSGKSFLYLGEVPTNPEMLKISLNSENQKVKGIQYSITIYH
jgi:type IV secretory pathway VirB10-like protein